jgi:hypothetical protein
MGSLSLFSLAVGLEGGLEPGLGLSQAVWSEAEASRGLKPTLHSYRECGQPQRVSAGVLWIFHGLASTVSLDIFNKPREAGAC